MESFRKQSKKMKKEDDDIESKPRKIFTKGWEDALKLKETLPIKSKEGKVIKSFRVESDDEMSADSGGASNDNNNYGGDSYSDSGAGIDRDSDSDSGSDKIVDIVDVSSVKMKARENDSQKDKRTAKKTIAPASRYFGSMNDAKIHIANICTAVTANPEKALAKKRSLEEEEVEGPYPRVSDLLELLTHSDLRISEMAMLSSLLVFKDICPSYRYYSTL